MLRTVLDRVIRPVWPVAIPMLLVVAAVVLFSFLSDSYQRDGVFMLVNILGVVGLWVFVGNSGIISFGHVAFLGIGAYTSAILTTPSQLKHILISGMPSLLADAHVSTPEGLLIAAAVSAVVALVIGIPIMRLSGLPAGIATLAILVIVNTVLGQWQSVTNGLQPFAGIPADATLSSTLPYVLIAIPIAHLFKRSRIGLRLQASREDEVAARAIGVGVVWERTIAFVLSAALVGAAGALYAHYLLAITPSVFYFQATFLLLMMLVVGGMKSLGGAVVGALVITGLTEGLNRAENSVSALQGLTNVVLALLLILILILRPRGLMGSREFRMPARWVGPPGVGASARDSLAATSSEATAPSRIGIRG